MKTMTASARKQNRAAQTPRGSHAADAATAAAAGGGDADMMDGIAVKHRVRFSLESNQVQEFLKNSKLDVSEDVQTMLAKESPRSAIKHSPAATSKTNSKSRSPEGGLPAPTTGKERHKSKARASATTPVAAAAAASDTETMVLNVVEPSPSQQPNANRPKKHNKAAKHAADFF
jgi:hypothetical protein